jgi:adenylate kinase
MKIVLLGAPGSGKGTQAKFIAEHFGIPHISTGDMLRAERDSGSELGKFIKMLIDDGNFVPDELIISLIERRILEKDCVNGFILDGFPRTKVQAEKMKEMGIPVDKAIEIDVPFDLIVERITGRLTHEASGRSYHIRYNPPKIAGLDDVTGEALIQRADDTAEVVVPRLDTYKEKTLPVVEFYKNEARLGNCDFIHVEGVGDFKEITQRIFDAIK